MRLESGRWAGAFTHFHSADDDPATLQIQWQRLVDVLSSLGHPRTDFLVHAQNSAGILRAGRLQSGGYRVDAVRPGIFLYGGSAGASPHRRSVRLIGSVAHLGGSAFRRGFGDFS